MGLLVVWGVSPVHAVDPDPTPAPTATPVIPRLGIDTIDYIRTADEFQVTISMLNPQVVNGLRVVVIKDGVLVVEGPAPLRPAPLVSVSLPAAGLQAGETYVIQVTALDTGGRPYYLDGETVLQASQSVGYKPPEMVLKVATAAIDGDMLVIEPVVVNGDKAATYEVRLAPAEGQAAAVPPLLVSSTLPGAGQSWRLPLTTIPSGTYVVQVRALDADGGELASARSESLAYSAPTGFDRALAAAGSGLIRNPLILCLMAGLVAVLVVWLMVRGRLATGTPMLQLNLSSALAAPEPPRSPRVVQPVFEPAVSGENVARLLITDSPDVSRRGQVKILGRAQFSIGREGCDLNLSDPMISRQHGRITFRPQQGDYCYVDLNSRNGSWVGQVRVKPDQWVRLVPGVELRLGQDTRLIFDQQPGH